MAEGKVEAPDQRTGYEAAKPAGGDREFRDQPKGLRESDLVEGRGERLNLIPSQAVEKEVRDDEVVRRVCRLPLAGVSAECADAGGVGAGSAPTRGQHFGARVRRAG